MNNLKIKYLYLRKYQPYLSPIKKDEKIRLNCITELGLIDTVKKIKAKILLKQSLLSKSKFKNMNNQMVSMKKVCSATFNIDKRNGNNVFIMNKAFNKSIKTILNNKINKFKFIQSLPSNRYSRNNFTLSTKRDNCTINSSRMISRNKNKNISQNYNYNGTNKTSRINSSKTKTILEVKKSIYKLLPIMNNSLNVTIGKSSHLEKELNFFQKEEHQRSQKSKRKKKKIMKKFFISYKMPSIIDSLIVKENKKYLSDNLSRLIFQSKRGKNNLQYQISKKKKSPLAFVEDYNIMRNRRRNNKNYENNLGFSANLLNSEKKIKKNIVLGMTFKDIKKVISHY